MTVAGAGGVVFDGSGNVLLLRHRNGTWVFPKGHIEEEEAPLTTALREIREEAGLEAHCSDPNTTFTTEYVNAHGERRRITWFLMEARSGTFRKSEDLFPEGGFREPAEALNLLTFPQDRELLQEILGHQGRAP